MNLSVKNRVQEDAQTFSGTDVRDRELAGFSLCVHLSACMKSRREQDYFPTLKPSQGGYVYVKGG